MSACTARSFESRATFKPLARPVSGPFAVAPTAATSAADVAAVKRVIEATRKGKEADADAAEASITDPVARKLAEWVILRSDNTNPTFQRYAAFVDANPSWPHAAAVPPPRRKRAVERRHRRPRRSRLLCQAPAVDRQGPLHAGARVARARRPRRRRGAGALRLAQRRLQRRGREAACSRCSATCSRAPTTRRAWSSASMPTTSQAACAPPNASAATRSRSARRARR